MPDAAPENRNSPSTGAFFVLTPIGGGDKVGAAKIDSEGRVYTWVGEEWRRFPGGKMELEDCFDLVRVETDPSLDIKAATFPRT